MLKPIHACCLSCWNRHHAKTPGFVPLLESNPKAQPVAACCYCGLAFREGYFTSLRVGMPKCKGEHDARGGLPGVLLAELHADHRPEKKP